MLLEGAGDGRRETRINNNNNGGGDVNKKRICGNGNSGFCCGCFGMSRQKQQQPPIVQPREEKNLKVETFTHSLTKLKPGTLISVHGTIDPSCVRFSIDLLATDTKKNSIALHFNPRLDRRCVVRNCKLNDAWGEEEIGAIASRDFHRDAPFTIAFLVTQKDYMVALNGRHFCAYAHRVPYEHVYLMEVRGAVNIVKIQTTLTDTYPPSTEVQEIPMLRDLDDEDVRDELEVPYIGKLPLPFKHGMQLEITGKIKYLPHMFYVNLQNGPQLWPHPVVPLHLNPRFNTRLGAHNFVRNTWTAGSWQKEECAPKFPFVPGYEFEMFVRMTNDLYSVWIDGLLVVEFPHRVSPETAPPTHVQIVGDVHIYRVGLRTNYFDSNKSTMRIHSNICL